MASKDNKLYTKVLVELDKIYKRTNLGGHYNNLVNLSYQTEDTELKQLIANYIQYLPKIEKYAKAKLYINTQANIMESEPHKIALHSYCEQILSRCKPEWQIIAERNGWRKV